MITGASESGTIFFRLLSLTSSSCKLLFSVYYNNCRSRNSHCLKTETHRQTTTNWAQFHTYPRIEPFDSTIDMRLVRGTKVSVPEQHWKAIIKRETETERQSKACFYCNLMQVEAHAKFRELQLRTTRGICTFYQCRHEIFKRERREGSKRQEKERKEKQKKGISDQYLFGERERERESARHILKGSTPWNPILGPNIRRIFFSFLARIRHFPMYYRSRTFFAGDYGANRWRTPHCARRSLQNENPPSPLVTNERPPRLLRRLRRLLRPARSFSPFSPGPSSSHPFLLLPTRLFVFLFFFLKKPCLLLLFSK